MSEREDTVMIAMTYTNQLWPGSARWTTREQLDAATARAEAAEKRVAELSSDLDMDWALTIRQIAQEKFGIHAAFVDDVFRLVAFRAETAERQLAELREALVTQRAYHGRMTHTEERASEGQSIIGPYCKSCGDDWPCERAQELDAALNKVEERET